MEPKKEKNYNAYSEEKKVKSDICYNAYSEEKQLYHQTNKKQENLTPPNKNFQHIINLSDKGLKFYYDKEKKQQIKILLYLLLMPITILLTFYINTLIAILILYVYILTTPIILAYTKTNLTLNSKLQKIILIISAAQILIVSIFIIKSIFEIGKNSRLDPTYSYQLKAEQITNIAENMYQSKKYNHLFKNNIIKLKDIENIESIKNPDRMYHYQFDYENSYIEIKENNQKIKSYIYLKSCTKKNKKCYILSSNSDDIFSQDIEYIEK